MMTRRGAAPSERQIGPVFDLEGRIDQALGAGMLVVPGRLELHEGCLCYQYYPGGPLDVLWLPPKRLRKGGPRRDLPVGVTPPPRLVDNFIKLVDAPEEEILSFAKRWGVLDLCSHGLPMAERGLGGVRRWNHGAAPGCPPLNWEPPDLDPELSGYFIGRERLSHWRQWARRARALMRIAANIAVNRSGAFEDWIELETEGTTAGELEERRAGLDRRGALLMCDRSALHCAVNDWVEVGRVGPRLIEISQGREVIRFSSGPHANLFGMIGLQMMVRVTRVGSAAICSQCGTLYKPDRLPNSSRQNFCQHCGRAAALKMAQRRTTDRKRRALEMKKAGVTDSEIALAVGSGISTVRGWTSRKRG